MRELGQKVTINYYENDNINSDKGRLSATFTLVGILNNYTNIWQDGKIYQEQLLLRKD